jgi:hypothetical protein
MATPEEIHAIVLEFTSNPGEYAAVLEDELEGFKYMELMLAGLCEGVMEHQVRAVAEVQLMFERQFYNRVYLRRDQLKESREKLVVIKAD